MRHYGIELEFFVRHHEKGIIPAYTVTSHVDGNPLIGELRTKPSTDIVEVVFELKKLLFLETRSLLKNHNSLLLAPAEIKVGPDFLAGLRKDSNYVNRKELEVLDEISVYDKKIGKILPRGVYKSSLQINISENDKIATTSTTNIVKKKKNKTKTTTVDRWVSKTFDFYSAIKKLDHAFSEEIKESGRVAGVFAIKQGEMGNRIEYRSLPSSVDLDKVIDVINSL